MGESLKAIYEEIYGSPFSYRHFEDRKKLQAAVYLLENMGLDIGDYGFSWDFCGPYSLSLDCQARQLGGGDTPELAFSVFAEECFKRLKDIAKRNTGYKISSWMECIASLHYLKNILRFKENDAIAELVRRNSHLSDEKSNRDALEVVGEIEA